MIGEREVFKTDHLKRIGDMFQAREKCKNRKQSKRNQRFIHMMI